MLEFKTEVQDQTNNSNERSTAIIFTGTINHFVKDGKYVKCGKLDFLPIANIVRQFAKSLKKIELKFIHVIPHIAENQRNITAQRQTEGLGEFVKQVILAKKLESFTLKDLDLELNPGDANQIASILRENQSIKHFVLDNFKLSFAAFNSIIIGLCTNKQLVSLGLPCCYLNKDNIVDLAGAAFGMRSHLRKLWLYEANITPECIDDLIMLAKENPNSKLQTICFSLTDSRQLSELSDDILKRITALQKLLESRRGKQELVPVSSPSVSPMVVQPPPAGIRLSRYGTCLLFDPSRATAADKFHDDDTSPGVFTAVATFMFRRK